MTSISSLSSASSAVSYTNALDKNGDGVVDAEELQEAAQAGLLQSSVLSDEDGGSDSQSATDVFSGNLASMLLQMQDSSGSTGTSSDGSSSTSDQSPMDALFASLDANGDGKVTSAEFVAGRPKDMSESDAASLFKSLDTQGSGSLDKGQFAEGLDVLSSTDQSAADVASLASTSGDSNTGGASDSNDQVDAFLAAFQASATAYQNTYGQYDDDPTEAVSA